jgi:hypothetical protein
VLSALVERCGRFHGALVMRKSRVRIPQAAPGIDVLDGTASTAGPYATFGKQLSRFASADPFNPMTCHIRGQGSPSACG